MSNSDPAHPYDSGPARPLRNRIVDIFRTSSQTSYSALPDSEPDGNGARSRDYPEYSSQEPNARTRLLESFHRPDSIFRSKSDSGMFSPRPEASKQPGWQSDYYGAPGRSGQASVRAGSAERSVNASSMEHLLSKSPLNNRTSLYVPQYNSRGNLIGQQISIVLCALLQLDWPIPLVLPARRLRSRSDGCLHLYSNGTVALLQPRACSPYQWSLFFRISTSSIRHSREQPPVNSWTGSRRIVADWCNCQIQH